MKRLLVRAFVRLAIDAAVMCALLRHVWWMALLIGLYIVRSEYAELGCDLQRYTFSIPDEKLKDAEARLFGVGR